MYKPRTGMVKAAWLLMLGEGGRWSAKEISTKLGQDLHSHLYRMTEQGCVARYPSSDDEPVQFGVTNDCKVPLGVTMKEIMEAQA
jgi:hypothetical protein